MLGTFSVAWSQGQPRESQNRTRVANNDEVQVGQRPKQNILEIAESEDRLQKFVDLSSLTPTLQGKLAAKGPFTVFAPTDAAFSELPYELIEELMQKENREQLAGLLNYHVVEGYYPMDSLRDGQQLRTLAGVTLEVTGTVGTIRINEALVETPDQRALNGILHIIEGVLIPVEGKKRERK